MNISTLYKLKVATEKASSLQRDWERQKRKLLALPGRLGFGSVRELQAALTLVSGSGAKDSTAGVRLVAKSPRKRAVITPEIKRKVKEFVTRGNTNHEVATTLGISAPTVQNIKKELGLVKPRA
jgi:hypothetical protein